MTFRSRTVRLAALFLTALVSARFVAAQDAPLQGPLQGFDEYVNKARAEWETPGLAIAIVKDDKVVFAKGYGVRKLGDSTPVNERTLFAIGSAGKSFTAAALAVLVDEDNIAPAGSINSNALDLAQWLRMQLGEGAHENKKIISSSAVKEMHKPQMIIPYNLQAPGTTLDANFTSYGFGWFLHDYHGRKIVQHGGGIDGMTALVAMMPQEKIGVAVLSNIQGSQLPWALMYRVFDAYLGLPPQDRSATFLASSKRAQERAKTAAKKMEDERVKGAKPSLPLEQYAGTYKDEMYGEATVTQEEGKLMFRYSPSFTGELEHWHYDTFRVKWPNPTVPESPVTFTLNAQGKAQEINVPGMADFKRVPARAATAAVR